MIAIHAGNSVPEYDQAWPKVEVDRPEACPLCHTAGQMIVHGRYPRQKPLEATPEPPQPVKVRRWLCKACRKTTSMLPASRIFHRYRQYTWAVIGAALIRRFVLRQTWAQTRSEAELSQMAGRSRPGAVGGQPAALVQSLRGLCPGLAESHPGGAGHRVAAVGSTERPRRPGGLPIAAVVAGHSGVGGLAITRAWPLTGDNGGGHPRRLALGLEPGTGPADVTGAGFGLWGLLRSSPHPHTLRIDG